MTVPARNESRKLRSDLISAALAMLAEPQSIKVPSPRSIARVLWSVQHGIVSLRLHKTDWAWELPTDEAVERAISALASTSGSKLSIRVVGGHCQEVLTAFSAEW